MGVVDGEKERDGVLDGVGRVLNPRRMTVRRGKPACQPSCSNVHNPAPNRPFVHTQPTFTAIVVGLSYVTHWSPHSPHIVMDSSSRVTVPAG